MTEPTESLPTSAEPAPPGRYVVIARRYRPQTFEELVGQEHVSRALQQAIKSDRVGHAYLFTGARGTGKTSAARILAKAINCVEGPTPIPCNRCDVCEAISSGDDVDVLEIDGASNNGVDQVRQLRQNAAVRPTRTRYKIYIIDEVHMLSGSAFNALLKTLEEPPGHVKFIFATTEPQKIPITILSRCQRFDFAGISASAIQERLAQIAAAEGVAVDREALQILASRAAGSMRDSQSLLEQLLAVGRDKITAADVNQLLGIAPAERLSELIARLVAREPAAALAELDATVASGVEVGLLLDQLVGYFRDVMAAAVGCTPDQFLYALPSQADEIAHTARELGLSTILAIGQILDHTAARMRISMHGRTLVEMAVVRICQLGELEDLAAMIAELRGETVGQPSQGGQHRAQPSALSAISPTAPAKTNDEGGDEPIRPANGLASAFSELEKRQTTAVAEAPISPSVEPIVTNSARGSAKTEAALPSYDYSHAEQSTADSDLRTDSAHAPLPQSRGSTATVDEVAGEAENGAASSESMLAQFQEYQRAMAGGTAPRVAVAPSRPSRREQTAKAAEHPFVRRAMELFDASPDKLRYTPPEERSGGVGE